MEQKTAILKTLQENQQRIKREEEHRSIDHELQRRQRDKENKREEQLWQQRPAQERQIWEERLQAEIKATEKKMELETWAKSQVNQITRTENIEFQWNAGRLDKVWKHVYDPNTQQAWPKRRAEISWKT